jgi:hypothetical protein
MSTNNYYHHQQQVNSKQNNPNKVVVTKLQGGYHTVNAPLATQPQTVMSVQNNAVVQQGGYEQKELDNEDPDWGVNVQNNWGHPNNKTNTTPQNQPNGSQTSKPGDNELNATKQNESEGEDDESEGEDDESENGDGDGEVNPWQEYTGQQDEGPSGGASDSDTASSVSTTELLGRDPLYLVLSSFLSNEEGENIVDVLSKINRNLAKLVVALDKEKKDERKNKADHTKKSKSKQ